MGSVSEPKAILAADDLTVRYGRKLTCDRIGLSVNEGEIFALLGRNGAGKSSLVRCLLGLRRPDSGVATLFGHETWACRHRLMGRVGSVPRSATPRPT